MHVLCSAQCGDVGCWRFGSGVVTRVLGVSVAAVTGACLEVFWSCGDGAHHDGRCLSVVTYQLESNVVCAVTLWFWTMSEPQLCMREQQLCCCIMSVLGWVWSVYPASCVQSVSGYFCERCQLACDMLCQQLLAAAEVCSLHVLGLLYAVVICTTLLSWCGSSLVRTLRLPVWNVGCVLPALLYLIKCPLGATRRVLSGTGSHACSTLDVALVFSGCWCFVSCLGIDWGIDEVRLHMGLSAPLFPGFWWVVLIACGLSQRVTVARLQALPCPGCISYTAL